MSRADASPSFKATQELVRRFVVAASADFERMDDHQVAQRMQFGVDRGNLWLRFEVESGVPLIAVDEEFSDVEMKCVGEAEDVH